MKSEVLAEIIRRYDQANFIVEKRLHNLLKEMMPPELTVDQFMTLRYIRHNKRVTSSELSDHFFVGRSSITAIINRLVDKRLIERHPDPSDRRVIYLALTKEGERLSLQLEEEMKEMLGRYLRRFSEEEAFLFIEMYERLAEVFMQPNEGEEK